MTTEVCIISLCSQCNIPALTCIGSTSKPPGLSFTYHSLPAPPQGT